MIAKISPTVNLGRALGYNLKKVRQEETTILLAGGLYQDQDGRYTMEQVLSDMQQPIPNKCRTKNTVFHCSLNPHSDEKLSDEQLTQIVKKYMEELEHGNQPYTIFKHNGIAHEHIHIVSFRVDGNGREINDRFEKRRGKKITDALEGKYSLTPSSLKKEDNGQIYDKADIGKGDIKQQVSSIVCAVLKHYTSCSLGKLNAILSRYNLVVEEVKVEYRGKRYDGLVYVPADNRGNKVSTPIHASDIGRGVGYIAVQNKMLKSKQSIKACIPRMRKKVLEIMRTSPMTEAELLDNLNKQCLHTVIRKNESGRIYDTTFIDDEKGTALNGSRLGKGYAASLFNAHLSNPAHSSFLDKLLYGKINTTPQQRMRTTLPEEQASDNPVDESIDNTVGESFSSSGNDDRKEVAWQRKLHKQNKVNLKRRKC